MCPLHPFGLPLKKCLIYCPQPDLLKHKNKKKIIKNSKRSKLMKLKKTKTKQERKENKSVMAG